MSLDPSPRLVAVGASAGGVEALMQFVEHLPGDLPALVLVVLHVSPGGTSVLPSILDRAGPLPATAVRDGQSLEPGRVVVAVADSHLLVEDGVLRALRSPRENGHRPAVDPLMRSVARYAGPGAIGVVLSGNRDDGTLGAAAIKAAGGLVFAQDPADAAFPSMPESALRQVAIDGHGTPEELAALVVEAVSSPVRKEMPVSPKDPSPSLDGHEAGDGGASGLTCPECGGAIWQDAVEGVPTFNCHTGHRYSPESMAGEQSRATEAALWVAIRHLDERAALLHRLAATIAGRSPSAQQRFEAAAHDAQRHAEVIRELVTHDAQAV